MNEPLTDEEPSSLLGTIAGPVWQDGCNHSKESYVASFEIWERDKLTTYDLYVFEQRGRSEVCLRYGSDGGDYLSPGDIGDFCRSSMHLDAREYQRAYTILQSFGTFHWKPKS